MAWRNVVAGQRVPMELTSLGRAWLAMAPDERRLELMAQFRSRKRRGWRALAREIEDAIDNVRRMGFCWAAWQPGVVALATPIVLADHPVYVLNMSVTGDMPAVEVVNQLREPLLALGKRLRATIDGL